MSAAIQLQESETPSGWCFIGEVTSDNERRAIEMVVSWPDYEYWGRGLVRPVDVAKALLRVAIRERVLHQLPEKFDAARLRRTIERFDDRVKGELGFEEIGE